MTTEARHTLPAEQYYSADTYAFEQEQLWYRQWVYAGRSELVADPGQFITVDIAGQSVIIIRNDDHEIKAFYNVCSHRGSLLCADAAGTTKAVFQCPYHAWCYDLNGTLVATPRVDADEVPRDELGLKPVAVDDWQGFMFVNLSREAPKPLRESLDSHYDSPVRFEKHEMDKLTTVHRTETLVHANWKVIVENYNECYHCSGVHPELCRIVPAFKEKGGSNLDWDNGVPQAEGTFTFTMTGRSDRSPFPGLDDDEQVRHKGELAYPNLMLSLSADHAAAFMLVPKAPDRTLVVVDFLFHPDEIAKPTFDPSDAVEFWDLVNRQDWAVCEGVQSGMTSRRFTFGWYAPMEDMSLDIRRYVGERLGEDGLVATSR
jgi:Rieske 2Fe-2S family protein